MNSKLLCYILFIFTGWYFVGIGNNLVSKLFLQDYPYPLTISLVTLLSTCLFTIPLSALQNRSVANETVKRTPVSLEYGCRFILPASLGKIVAVASAQFSLWLAPVSFVHTVKATMPLFTVCTARVLLAEKQDYKVYLSLLPIVCGVVLASATELSFNIYGLLCALLSTFLFSLINTVAKKIYNDTNMKPMRLASVTAQIACVGLIPIWAAEIVYRLINTKDNEAESNTPSGSSIFGVHFFLLLFGSGILGFLQNLLAFILMRHLEALSYSVANASKRVGVIGFSLWLFMNPVTFWNILGMTLAVLGVLLYGLVSPVTIWNILGIALAVLGVLLYGLVSPVTIWNILGIALAVLGVLLYGLVSPVTIWNILGMTLAVLGVLLYGLTKDRVRRTAKKTRKIKLKAEEANGTQITLVGTELPQQHLEEETVLERVIEREPECADNGHDAAGNNQKPILRVLSEDLGLGVVKRQSSASYMTAFTTRWSMADDGPEMMWSDQDEDESTAVEARECSMPKRWSLQTRAKKFKTNSKTRASIS